jgi:hypothetical protein
MALHHTTQPNVTGSAVIERQIDQAETFLHALESDSLLALNISYKHEVEFDYSVYDQLSEDLIDPQVLKRYLQKHLKDKLRELKGNNGNNKH